MEKVRGRTFGSLEVAKSGLSDLLLDFGGFWVVHRLLEPFNLPLFLGGKLTFCDPLEIDFYVNFYSRTVGCHYCFVLDTGIIWLSDSKLYI